MSQAKFRRFNFSLTEPISKDIDELSLKPREFKCSRSDVVKAAIQFLKEQSAEDQILILKKASSSNDID